MALKPVTVSQLNSYIKRILQTDPLLGRVSVTGEISNLKFHGSGHVYFSLKDDSSKINCFLSAGNLPSVDYIPEEGAEVVAEGYVYLYERGGTYSLNIRNLEMAGIGELAMAYEKLKVKLEKEGLFDKKHKKELPFFPEKIAVVTSETGAAVRDILKIIKGKNDFVDIMICPVLVQGSEAPGQISEALDYINKNHSDVDVIITGRGGGSMEELMAFNDERVARSIFASDIPVISAVGHETDFTIADFVADARAETPTAAANMAVPDTSQLREIINGLKNELKRTLTMRIENDVRHLKLMNPQSFARDLQSRIAMEQMTSDNIISDMENRIRGHIASLKGELVLLKESLEGTSPNNILKRGYCVVSDTEGKMITDASLLENGQLISIKAAKGCAKAAVTEAGTDDDI